MDEAARSAYEVRVVTAAPGETGRAWFLGGLLAAFFKDGFGVATRTRVEIVATGTGDVLVDWKTQPVDAGLLKEKIESDLDRMDAQEFATEWGLPPPPANSVRE
jgi:hypothetical protein